MATTLDTYISELLFDYDCVIVPQLGGFVTNYSPALIDEKTGVAHPGRKDIRFNRNLTKNDGLLAQAFAEAEGWSHEVANTHISKEVESYLSKLREGEKVKFKKIGILYLDTHRNFRFEPSHEQNFLKASAGFEAFSLPPILKAQKPNVAQPSALVSPTEVNTQMASETPVIPIAPEPILIESNRSISWVAAATLLPFIGLSIYMGIVTGFKSPADITLADLNPFSARQSIDARYTPRNTQLNDDKWVLWPSAQEDEVIPAPKELSVERTLIDSTSVKTASEIEIATKSEALISGKYHIIGGCFREEENAKRFVSRLSEDGISAAILDQHKGLYRVRLQSYDQYNNALEGLQAVRAKSGFTNAWLLKKPTY